MTKVQAGLTFNCTSCRASEQPTLPENGVSRMTLTQSGELDIKEVFHILPHNWGIINTNVYCETCLRQLTITGVGQRKLEKWGVKIADWTDRSQQEQTATFISDYEQGYLNFDDKQVVEMLQDIGVTDNFKLTRIVNEIQEKRAKLDKPNKPKEETLPF